jgi:predicted permease
MSSFLVDVRLALRGWRNAPGFTAIAVLSIALGIGVTAAIFTLVDHVLLRALPIRDPESLVQLSFEGMRYGSNWGEGTELSHPMYKELRDRNDVFEGVCAGFNRSMNVGRAGQTERVAGQVVSGTYFTVLGVGAAMGRVLSPDDDRTPLGHPVVVLSYGFWQSRFASDPSVVNSSILINGHSYTIVGVARQGFDGDEVGRQTQVYVPMMMKRQITPGWNGLDERLFRWVRVFARLRPGVTREQAQGALQPYFTSLLQRDLNDPEFARASARDRQRYLENHLTVSDASQGRSRFRETMTTPLWVLMATAAGVLLIACANVANLLVARGASRQREMAVRLALGASRGRICSQLIVESVVLALAGGAVGLGIAAIGAPIVLAFFTSPETPQPISTAPDWRILAFTFGVSTMTGVLFGLAPALQSIRPRIAPTLKEHAGSVLGGHARLRKGLVASQVAVSLLLLAGAALFIRTLDNLLKLDVGFDTARVISFSIDPTLNGYTPQRTQQFARSLLERLNATAGIERAGLATERLLEGGGWTSSITVEGYQGRGGDETSTQWCNTISPGYFRTMGIPVMAGRDFDDRDLQTAISPESSFRYRVAIANETFARHYFGDKNPIGRRIGFGGNPNTPTPIEIIGVVRDSKYSDVRDETPRQLFFPYLEDSNPGGFTMYVRTTRPADTMFSAIRHTVAGIDPSLPVYDTRTLEHQVDQSLRRERLVATMTAVFGALATLLAVVGLYGVMSYTVARRTREIGVRVAFGAQANDIRWLVLREVMFITATGIAIGLPTAWWLGRYVSTQLYGVKPGDPVAIGGAVVLLALIACVAGLVPSARAARLDPTVALRQD